MPDLELKTLNEFRQSIYYSKVKKSIFSIIVFKIIKIVNIQLNISVETLLPYFLLVGSEKTKVIPRSFWQTQNQAPRPKPTITCLLLLDTSVCQVCLS